MSTFIWVRGLEQLQRRATEAQDANRTAAVERRRQEASSLLVFPPALNPLADALPPLRPLQTEVLTAATRQRSQSSRKTQRLPAPGPVTITVVPNIYDSSYLSGVIVSSNIFYDESLLSFSAFEPPSLGPPDIDGGDGGDGIVNVIYYLSYGHRIFATAIKPSYVSYGRYLFLLQIVEWAVQGNIRTGFSTRFRMVTGVASVLFYYNPANGDTGFPEEEGEFRWAEAYDFARLGGTGAWTNDLSAVGTTPDFPPLTSPTQIITESTTVTYEDPP